MGGGYGSEWSSVRNRASFPCLSPPSPQLLPAPPHQKAHSIMGSRSAGTDPPPSYLDSLHLPPWHTPQARAAGQASASASSRSRRPWPCSSSISIDGVEREGGVKTCALGPAAAVGLKVRGQGLESTYKAQYPPSSSPPSPPPHKRPHSPLSPHTLLPPHPHKRPHCRYLWSSCASMSCRSTLTAASAAVASARDRASCKSCGQAGGRGGPYVRGRSD